MLLLGIDLGTSSIKVSVVDAGTRRAVASVSYPETEADILAPEPGWAEQDPDLWWEHTVQAILKAHATGKYDPGDIAAIGISYQMHGLVTVDDRQRPLRNSIIWCDSRATAIGDKALQAIGKQQALAKLLNFPGNFTAAKLGWVKENEPELYGRIDKVMLPGDFLAMKLTGEIGTSISALSEGIFWDFVGNELSQDILAHFGFEKTLFPKTRPVFSTHGTIREDVARQLRLSPKTAVAYKAGDQPNNAFSLNVLENGELATTAGTSGVVYAVSDQFVCDPQSRVNTFAHVNYLPQSVRTGMLLCINGTGIQNRWIRNLVGTDLSYSDLNAIGETAAVGSAGLRILPFGNGAERMLDNRTVLGQIHNIDFNRHGRAEIVRAGQEGIACAFRYGVDLLRANGVDTSVVRAGHANLFLSPLFARSFVNFTGLAVELFDNDGSVGAALGAGVGIGHYASPKEAVRDISKIRTIEPEKDGVYEEIYMDWKKLLEEKN